MNEPETREERILRIMWEQNVTRGQAEPVADAEMRFEELRALAMFAALQSGREVTA